MLQLQFWNMLLQKCWMDSQTWPECGFLLPTPPKADLESFTLTCVSSLLVHTLPASCVRHQQRWRISVVSQFTFQSLSLAGKIRWQLKLVSLSPRQEKRLCLRHCCVIVLRWLRRGDPGADTAHTAGICTPPGLERLQRSLGESCRISAYPCFQPPQISSTKSGQAVALTGGEHEAHRPTALLKTGLLPAFPYFMKSQNTDNKNGSRHTYAALYVRFRSSQLLTLLTSSSCCHTRMQLLEI